MKLLFFDVETGGLDPAHHSLLQVAMVAYIDGKVTGQLNVFIKRDEYIVGGEAMKYNNMNLVEVWEKGLPPTEVTTAIIGFIHEQFGADKPTPVGHNPSIDKYFMYYLFKEVGLDWNNYVGYRMIDTMSLLNALYDAGKLPEKAVSGGAFEYFKACTGKKHDALDDTISTVKLYEGIQKVLKGEEYEHS